MPLIFSYRHPNADFPARNSTKYIEHYGIHVTNLAHIFSLIGLSLATFVLGIALFHNPPVPRLSVVGTSIAVILLHLGVLYALAKRKLNFFWPLLSIFGVTILLLTLAILLLFVSLSFQAIGQMGKEDSKSLCSVYYNHDEATKYFHSGWPERNLPKASLMRCRDENTDLWPEYMGPYAILLVIDIVFIRVYGTYFQAWRYLKAENAWLKKNIA